MKKLFLLSLFSLLFSGCEFSDQDVQNTLEILESEISEEKKENIPEKTRKNTPENSLKKKLDIPHETHLDENLYEINYLYDGDTYQVFIDGKKEKIRVLGIDTPEKKGGFRPEGCFGGHASTYSKKQLLKKKVGLLKPKNHENTDKYGRLLRYVFLDGKDFGAHLIQEGYAFSYKNFSHPRLQYYNQLEKEAQKNKKGMWNPENCDYWGQNNLID